MSESHDIRVVVGLDFGTTYSGFTYCHVSDEEFITNESWPGDRGHQFKTNTVLQYDESYTNVKSWGHPALSRRPDRRLDRNRPEYVVELFKLHVGDISDTLKERYRLPIHYKKAVTDYLREIGKLIKKTITETWADINFLENVLLVLTVPAEYTERSKATMRECAYKADLTDDINSKYLQFTTESEAAAIYCMDNCLREHDLASGSTFMTVNSGGGTVDLTTVKVLNERQLGEVTERVGDYCGSALVDEEFRKYLESVLGDRAFALLRDNYYGHLQYMVQEFCQHVKFPFTGDDTTFAYEIKLEKFSPILSQHLSDDKRQKLEDAEWLIKLDYKNIKSMFDPVIDRILRLIDVQLSNCHETCSAIFLVGDFSQSEYLQKRIRQKFEDYRVYVPTNPIAAVSRGAAIYGLSFRKVEVDLDGTMFVINSRVLKFTYGIKIYSPWKTGDPEERRKELFRFHCIGGAKKARRGTSVNINEEFTIRVKPTKDTQTHGDFEIYYTRDHEANYCDEPEVKLLGKLIIDWPGNGTNSRYTTIKLTFGQMEVKATAINNITGQSYRTSFKLGNDMDPSNKVNSSAEELFRLEVIVAGVGFKVGKETAIITPNGEVSIDVGKFFNGLFELVGL